MPEATQRILDLTYKINNRINPRPPIVIWQMGKVGSSSVYESLKRLHIVKPIFHIHFMNPINLNRVRNEFYRKGLPLPRHIHDGEMLLNRYLKRGGNGWKILTIVRELAKIHISGFFQNIKRWSYDHNGLLTNTGDINTNSALQLLQDRFCNFNESTDYVCNWFDQEIKQMLKIDVFNHPFDHEKGYTIIKENNIELLILKTESLNSTFNEAISTFFNLAFPVRLKNANISEKKHYSQEFKRVRDELVIPDDVLSKINSSKYMRHFYPYKDGTHTVRRKG